MTKIIESNKNYNEELLKLFPKMEIEWNKFILLTGEYDAGGTVVFEDVLCPYAFRLLREGEEEELRRLLSYITSLACGNGEYHDASIFFMESLRSKPGWSLITQYFPEEGKEIFLSDELNFGPDRMDERGVYNPDTYFELYENMHFKKAK